ncbi:MAG: hypothetical protein AB7G68_02515 [Nitrospiraceae bacterium]
MDPEDAVSHLWSIGIYAGSSPYRLNPKRDILNPVLTRESVSDVRALFVADPFMIRRHDTWYMFFEVYNYDSAKGEIGLATSRDGLAWQYQQIVLRESFHLSYPYVFEWDGRYYMIPESHQAESVRLYESRRFPVEWTCTDVLISGGRFSDNSPFRYHDVWWMFSETSAQLEHDTLRLYYSRTLHGPWREHPASPVVRNDPHRARPAGRVIVWQGRPIRFAQDCYPVYGTRIRAFEISDLSIETYHERRLSKRSILGPGLSGWNLGGMHHIDPHLLGSSEWIAPVDGWEPVWQLVPNDWHRVSL